MYRAYLAVLILQNIGFHPVNNSLSPQSKSSRMSVCIYPFTSGFYPIELSGRIVQETCKDTYSIASSPYTSDNMIGMLVLSR